MSETQELTVEQRAELRNHAMATSMLRQSADMGEFYVAFLEAQSKFTVPAKNKTAQVKSDKGSYSFKYADLAAVLDSVRPQLNAAGVILMQPVVTGQNGPRLLTRLVHAMSGQWLEMDMVLPNVGDRPQTWASALSYLRRYAVTAVCCLASEDDDANMVTRGNKAQIDEISHGPSVPYVKDSHIQNIVTRLGKMTSRAQDEADGTDIVAYFNDHDTEFEKYRGGEVQEWLEKTIGGALKTAWGQVPAAAWVSALRAETEENSAKLYETMAGKWRNALDKLGQEAAEALSEHITLQGLRVAPKKAEAAPEYVKAPDFLHALYDINGEAITQPLGSPAAYAGAFRKAWNDLSAPEDEEARSALIEANGPALEVLDLTAEGKVIDELIRGAAEEHHDSEFTFQIVYTKDGKTAVAPTLNAVTESLAKVNTAYWANKWPGINSVSIAALPDGVKAMVLDRLAKRRAALGL